jgi:hypothetical protein
MLPLVAGAVDNPTYSARQCSTLNSFIVIHIPNKGMTVYNFDRLKAIPFVYIER